MTGPGLRVTTDGGLARIILAAGPHNILTRALLAELRQTLARLALEPTLRVLLLSAEGKHFSAGADVAEHLPPVHQAMIPEFLETVAALDGFPLPVLAAVRGRCLGGAFELVLGADIVLAGDSAQFGQPEIVLGVLAPAAAAWLPLRCSRGAGAELLFSGDPVTAAEAERLGLVRRVVPDPDLESAALALAGRISRHSGSSLRLAKAAFRSGPRQGEAAALRAAGELYLTSLMATEDALEGLHGFLEKRQPVWRHR
jgi:cyclohexa-1,5-dienecarbonyl-CoA hydratase